MSAPNVSYLHGITANSQFLSQLTDCTPTTNHDILTGMASGHPFPLATYIMGAKPDVQFKTQQLATLLALTGANGLGLAVSSEDEDDPFILYYKKATQLGTRDADNAGTHQAFTMADGLLYFTSISASYQKPAEASVRIKPISTDGQTAPLVPAGNENLDGTCTADEVFTLGPIVINGSTIDSQHDVNIDMGFKMYEDGAADDVFDRRCHIEEMLSTITISGTEVGWWNDYGLDGAALSSWVVYLRRKAMDGYSVANDQAQHIKLSGNYGLIVTTDTQGGGNNASRTSLKLQLRSPNVGGFPMTIETGKAIT